MPRRKDDDRKCARCGVPLDVWIMSVFNTELICMECKEDEKLAPGYSRARAIEVEHVHSRDFNFTGVGLSTADREFLQQRRAFRKAKKEEAKNG